MKTLVISRPIYDYILPLVEFPMDGDNFFINNSIKTLTNVGTLTAIVLAKFGINISYTGMIGEDEQGRKIKELLESYNIDTKYIETSFTEKTCSSFRIYNQKTNKFTSITERSIKTDLTKYKYEFIPDIVIMDDGDYGANLAAINNFSNSKLIYIGEKFTTNSKIYCNKCNYIITSLAFASDATGVQVNLSKTKTVVQMFQKFIDLYNANLIIKLNNFDVLYIINDEVRLIKNVNKNISNKDNLFNAILIYFLINTNDIENSIKFTNKVMLETNNKLDMLKNIPDYKVVKELLDNFKINIEESNKVKDNIDNNVINDEKINTRENIQIQNEVIEKPIINNMSNQNIDNGVNEIEKL